MASWSASLCLGVARTCLRVRVRASSSLTRMSYVLLPAMSCMCVVRIFLRLVCVEVVFWSPLLLVVSVMSCQDGLLYSDFSWVCLFRTGSVLDCRRCVGCLDCTVVVSMGTSRVVVMLSGTARLTVLYTPLPSFWFAPSLLCSSHFLEKTHLKGRPMALDLV